MNSRFSLHRLTPVALSAVVLALAPAQAQNTKNSFPVDVHPSPKMSFFVSGFGTSHGGDFVGVKGADAHCQRLAQSVGLEAKTWRAYLSADAADGQPAVNARDRIGKGPWYNFKGETIAKDVADLHSDNNRINKQTALTQTGGIVPGIGDTPNMHDILTGANADGTLAPGLTCKSWTSQAKDDRAQVGHADRMGAGSSWNSAHSSRSCTQADFQAAGGDGLIYCFATN
jgi:hypothetical protein